MRIDDEAAYVLEARPYRESSLLLELLTTHHGRLAAVARGVRGERPGQRHKRALLEPFRQLRIDAAGRGEVLTLGRVEDTGQAPVRPIGNLLLSAFYVNELIRKLTPRQDPAPGVFLLYQGWLAQLQVSMSTSPDTEAETRRGGSDRLELAWTLRCFERDLLSLLGYALALDHDSDTGQAIDPKGVYALDPEQGARVWLDGSPWVPVSGATLLAWAGEDCPDEATATELRRLARSLIRHHLGGAELDAWRLARQWQ